MGNEPKFSMVLTALVVIFLALALMFFWDLWGHPRRLAEVPLTDSVYSNPETVRFSVSELIHRDEDTSGLDCYACHEENEKVELQFGSDGNVKLSNDHKDLIIYRSNCYTCHDKSEPVELEYDDDYIVIMPEAHEDLILRHGDNSRNNNCFKCHDSENLELLSTKDDQKLSLEESNLLCASCHGPTFNDWESGIHGRTSGYWDKNLGPSKRTDCTSCHDPHAPQFPSMIPGPSPHLHLISADRSETEGER